MQETKTFRCDICDKSIKNKTNLANHISAVHEGYKPFQCDICDYSSSRKSNLKRHVEIVHVGKKPFKCDICDYSCSQKGNMKRHIASVHEWKNIQMWQKIICSVKNCSRLASHPMESVDGRKKTFSKITTSFS